MKQNTTKDAMKRSNSISVKLNTMGFDEIYLDILLELTGEVAKPVSIISEKLWSSGEAPSDQKRGNITPISERNKGDPGNCRPVNLISVTHKHMHGANSPRNSAKGHEK